MMKINIIDHQAQPRTKISDKIKYHKSSPCRIAKCHKLNRECHVSATQMPHDSDVHTSWQIMWYERPTAHVQFLSPNLPQLYIIQAQVAINTIERNLYTVNTISLYLSKTSTHTKVQHIYIFDANFVNFIF